MTETLTCRECGNDWQRERKRGVKPKTCPDCKGATAQKPVSAPRNSTKAKATQPKTKAVSEQPRKPRERKSTLNADDTGLYIIRDENGVTISTTRDKAYADRRNKGWSYCCAHGDHLGKLCEREQQVNDITCTCKCHNEQELVA